MGHELDVSVYLIVRRFFDLEFAQLDGDALDIEHLSEEPRGPRSTVLQGTRRAEGQATYAREGRQCQTLFAADVDGIAVKEKLLGALLDQPQTRKGGMDQVTSQAAPP